jgi:dolichol-phosphate mannosyltransferase
VSDLATVVVIPTYDECDNIMRIVERVLDSVPQVRVLVVDDGSPDGTGAIADRIAATDGRVFVLHRRSKQGLGAAYVAGFAWALERGFEAVVEMDADGSHAPEELPRLLQALEHSDVVLGSRWVPGGSVHNWPASRRVLSRAGNLYTRIALGIDLKDATGGFRAYRAGALQSMEFADVSSQGYCFQVELAWRAVQAGFTVVEVPITFTERQRGQSKMSADIVAEALVSVTRWGARYRWSRLTGAPSPRPRVPGVDWPRPAPVRPSADRPR